MNNVFKTLQARGLVAQATDAEAIEKLLCSEPVTFYIGFDATADSLHLPTLFIICLTAAILGDACNYMIGEKLGHQLIARHNRLIRPEHIEKAQKFYEKHGHKAIFLARFVPIVRTFAPFVAGIGNMHYRTFAVYNIIGAIAWVTLFIGAGYFFGNMSFVKNNFSHVTLGIIVFSVLPIVFEIIKARKENK